MVSMDLNRKGITWAGSIYQKFETVCHQEVEDIVCPDTLKYVESQVQTVGENVKKFYVEVVQDLLLPMSFDPSKLADSDLSLEENSDVEIRKQSMVVVEKDALKEKPALPKEPKSIASVQKDSDCVACNVSQLPPHSSVKPVTEDLFLDQDHFSMHKLSKVGHGEDKNEKSPLVDATEVIAPAHEYSGGRSLLCILNQYCDELTKSAPSSPVEAWFNTLRKAGSIDSSVLCETLDISNAVPSSDLVLPVVRRENKTVEIGQSLSAKNLSTESNVGSLKDGLEQGKMCGTEVGTFTSPSEIGKSNVHEELHWGNDAVDQGIDIIEEDEHVKLGESCIVVDSKEFHFTSPREVKNRSYKKKLRDAFASRKGLAKKDYEQLAIWCEKLDARTIKVRGETSALSTLHDSCDESEWEFL